MVKSSPSPEYTCSDREIDSSIGSNESMSKKFEPAQPWHLKARFWTQQSRKYTNQPGASEQLDVDRMILHTALLSVSGSEVT